MSDPQDAGESGRAYAEALGEGLSRLHEVQADVTSFHDMETLELLPHGVTHAERVIGQVDEWLAACREATSDCGDADAEWAHAIVDQNRAALDVGFQPCWVHHDWKASNVLAQRRGEGWHVTGVVDLMEGYFGDPEEDLVRSIARLALGDRARIRRFTDAYRQERPLRQGFEARYRIYQLIDCMVIYDYGKRNLLWIPEGTGLRAFAEHFVSVLEPFGP